METTYILLTVSMTFNTRIEYMPVIKREWDRILWDAGHTSFVVYLLVVCPLVGPLGPGTVFFRKR